MFFLLSLERKETNRAQQDLDNKSELELARVTGETARGFGSAGTGVT